MQRHGEGDVAVGNAVRLQLHQCATEPGRFDVRRRVEHGGRGSLGFLDMRHHAVASLKIMALGAPDLASGGLQGVRTPLKSDGEIGVQAIQVRQEVRPRLGRWPQERVEDDRLAVEPQEAALRLQLREGQAPVEGAAGTAAVPRNAGAVDELGKEGVPFRIEDGEGGDVRC